MCSFKSNPIWWHLPPQNWHLIFMGLALEKSVMTEITTPFHFHSCRNLGQEPLEAKTPFPSASHHLEGGKPDGST